MDDARPIRILYAEDNPGDARLTVEAFKEAKVLNHIEVVPDGEEAMAYMRQEGKYAGVEAPDLMLLDLNMPKKDGLEVLREIKADPVMRRVPVVILTVSRAERDIVRAYDLHANCYVSKPVDFERFLQVVRSIEGFWLTVVRLPPK
jgi:CheY-like chemotaxis protein